MQGQKNTRRKRRDHESRDFTCRCGKSYLSYAAAYTHVKNKHNLEKQFLEDIGKPQRQKLPRGRPKERQQAHSSVQIEQLSVIEEAILKIYQILHTKFEKVILEGNSKKNELEVQDAYQKLIDKKVGASLKGNDQTDMFICSLSKHFTSQISAKIKLVVLIASKLVTETYTLNADTGKQIIAQLNSYNFWNSEDQINSIIYESFLKWQSLATNE